jgi:hypothetical protein
MEGNIERMERGKKGKVDRTKWEGLSLSTFLKKKG